VLSKCFTFGKNNLEMSTKRITNDELEFNYELLLSDKNFLIFLKPLETLVLRSGFKVRGWFLFYVILELNCLTPMGSLAFREGLWLQRFDPDGVSKSKLNSKEKK
jgi:hypothetical protein